MTSTIREQVYAAIATYNVGKICEDKLVEVLRYAREEGLSLDELDYLKDTFKWLRNAIDRAYGGGPTCQFQISQYGSIKFINRRSLSALGPRSLRSDDFMKNDFFSFTIKKGVAILSIQGLLWRYFKVHDSPDIDQIWEEFYKKNIEPILQPMQYDIILKKLEEKWTGRKVTGPRVSMRLDNPPHAVAYLGALLGALKRIQSEQADELEKYTYQNLDLSYHHILQESIRFAVDRKMRFQLFKKKIPKSFREVYNALLELLSEGKFPVEILKDGRPIYCSSQPTFDEFNKEPIITGVHDWKLGDCCIACGKKKQLRRSENLTTHPKVYTQHTSGDYLNECRSCQALLESSKQVLGNIKKDIVIRKYPTKPIELFSLNKMGNPWIVKIDHHKKLSLTLNAYHYTAMKLAEEAIEEAIERGDIENVFLYIDEKVLKCIYDLRSDKAFVRLDNTRLEILAKLYACLINLRIHKNFISQDNGAIMANVVRQVCEEFNLWGALYTITTKIPLRVKYRV
ncbi:MAG: hypothetical protein QXP55_04410 [Nitrososphaerales archaeon]